MKRGVRLYLLIAVALALLPFIIADSYESDNSYQNSSWINVAGETQTHNFTINDQDWVKFNATAGYTYIINTTNYTDISITDTQIELYDTDGTTKIAENDDIKLGVTRTSYIAWRATVNGTYFVKIFEWSNSGGGVYGIQVEQQGILEPYLISPTQNSEVNFNESFNISTGVRCIGGPCKNVQAILDPQENNKTQKKDILNGSTSANVIVTFKEDSYTPKFNADDSDGLKISKQKSRSRILERKANRIARRTGVDINNTGSSSAIFTANITQEELDNLLNRDDVLNVELDKPISILLSSSVPSINANDVQNIQIDTTFIDGATETVCVIDTGVNYSHSDFGSCPQTSNINNASCPKVLGGYDFVNLDDDPTDDHGHGSHVAGTVASTDSTYKGVAPGANIVAIKALDAAGGGSLSNAVLGVDWCVSNATALNISVITMSIGTPSYHSISDCDREDTAMAASIDAARQAGIIVTVASGNEDKGRVGPQGISDPGCVRNATSVGATNDATAISTYTNRGPTLDLLAPGDSIVATDRTGGHKIDSGTSMATPHVAGLSALLLQYFKLTYERTLLPQELEYIMKFSGTAITDTPTGLVFSRIDALNATNFKGMVSTTIGAMPFYTTSTNPVSCGTMQAGDTCNSTWQVIQTKTGSYEFFTIYTDEFNEEITSKFNVSSIEEPLNITLNKIANTSMVSLNGTLNYTITVLNNNNETLSINLTENFDSNDINIINSSINHTNYTWLTTLNAFENFTLEISAKVLTDGTITNAVLLTANTSTKNTNLNDSVDINVTDVTAPVVNGISTQGALIENQNFTVILNASDNTAIDTAIATINNLNYTFNSSYQINVNIGQSGNYSVNIFVNDTSGNVHSSFSTILAILSDIDGDGIADQNDTVQGNASTVDSTGISNLVIEIGGNPNIGGLTPSGVKLVEFKKGTNSLIKFNHNFSQSTFNFNNVKLIQGVSELVIYLGINVSKTVYFDDSSYDSLCILDLVVNTSGQVSSNCDQTNEYDLTSCIGNSTGVNVSHIYCEDLGNEFMLVNLSHSAIKGTETTTSSSSSSSSGGGGGGGGSSTITSTKKTISVIPLETLTSVILNSADYLQLTLDNQTYTLTFKSFNNGIATLTRMDGTQIGLVKGVSFNIDVDGDSKKDVTVTFEGDQEDASELSIQLYLPKPRVSITPPIKEETIDSVNVATQESNIKEQQEETRQTGIIGTTGKKKLFKFPDLTSQKSITNIFTFVVIVLALFVFAGESDFVQKNLPKVKAKLHLDSQNKSKSSKSIPTENKPKTTDQLVKSTLGAAPLIKPEVKTNSKNKKNPEHSEIENLIKQI